MTAGPGTSRGTFRREYAALPDAVEKSARDLSAYALRCGVAPAARTRAATACAEIFDNVVRHAFPVAEGFAVLDAEIEERDLVVRIRDRGVGFDAATAGLDHMRDSMDGGLARASALSEDLQIESTDSGTEVRMRFAAYRVHFDEEVHVDLTELDFLTPRTARRVLETLRVPGGEDVFHLSPALAVTVGRLLAGPDPRRVVQTTLWT